MEALYDPLGEVYAWLDERASRIVDRRGQHVAVIRGDRVHDYQGRHLGWWDSDHFRDRSGAVALFKQGARGMGVIPPIPALPPIPPLPALAPLAALPALPPLRPLNRMAWAEGLPF
jgi:hypothetical protein